MEKEKQREALKEYIKTQQLQQQRYAALDAQYQASQSTNYYSSAQKPSYSTALVINQ